MSKILGAFDGKEATALLSSLCDSEPSDDLLAEVAWSVLCEPGDSTAGNLVDYVGAAEALGALINRTPVAVMRDHMISNGFEISEDRPISKLDHDLASGLERWMPRLSYAAVFESLQIHSAAGGKVLFEAQSSWPSGLADLGAHRPRMLWYRGNLPAIEKTRQSIAIVGARASTGYGDKVTQDMVAGLGAAGLTIVSGGAYGIDAQAHRAALALEVPTVAVLAGGLDTLYPRGNAQLLGRIIAEGALVAEVAPKTNPSKWRFLQRNRLIAAMSQATLVVEAGYKSGARNTASHASALFRPVFAVPGLVTSPSSEGCHLLISTRVAELVQGPEDLLQVLGLADLKQSVIQASLSPNETRALDALGYSAITADEVARSSGLTLIEAQSALGLLQLSGLAIRQGAQWISIGRSTV